MAHNKMTPPESSRVRVARSKIKFGPIFFFFFFFRWPKFILLYFDPKMYSHEPVFVQACWYLGKLESGQNLSSARAQSLAINIEPRPNPGFRGPKIGLAMNLKSGVQDPDSPKFDALQ